MVFHRRPSDVETRAAVRFADRDLFPFGRGCSNLWPAHTALANEKTDRLCQGERIRSRAPLFLPLIVFDPAPQGTAWGDAPPIPDLTNARFKCKFQISI